MRPLYSASITQFNKIVTLFTHYRPPECRNTPHFIKVQGVVVIYYLKIITGFEGVFSPCFY